MLFKIVQLQMFLGVDHGGLEKEDVSAVMCRMQERINNFHKEASWQRLREQFVMFGPQDTDVK